jgi:hypothetical protein
MNPVDLGIVAACMNEKVSPGQLPEITGLVRGMRKSAGADAMGRQVAGFARDLFVEIGEPGSFEACLYGELAKVASWEPVHFDLLRPVYLALSGLEKRAEDGWIGSTVKHMIGAGMLAGGGLGTLHWALNRDASADDAKSKSLAARTDLYRRMAAEISAELKQNPPEPVEEAMKRKVRQEEQAGV